MASGDTWAGACSGRSAPRRGPRTVPPYQRPPLPASPPTIGESKHTCLPSANTGYTYPQLQRAGLPLLHIFDSSLDVLVQLRGIRGLPCVLLSACYLHPCKPLCPVDRVCSLDAINGDLNAPHAESFCGFADRCISYRDVASFVTLRLSRSSCFSTWRLALIASTSICSAAS